MSDRITYCDIFDDCRECPRCGNDCDGRESEDEECASN